MCWVRVGLEGSSHMDGRSLTTWAISHCFSRYISRELNWKVEQLGNVNSCAYGLLGSQALQPSALRSSQSGALLGPGKVWTLSSSTP